MHWNRCILATTHAIRCRESRRSANKNARNSYVIRYTISNAGGSPGSNKFAEVHFFFSISLPHIPSRTRSNSIDDLSSDGSTDCSTYNLAYIRTLPHMGAKSLLYTPNPGPFEAIPGVVIQDLVGLIKRQQHLYIVNGEGSEWNYTGGESTDY